MAERAYDALLVDLDGTLLNGEGALHPRNLQALRSARGEGVLVMVVTGRSKMAAEPILEQIGLDTPAVLFNGAAVYCPERGGLIEERTLSSATLERVLSFGEVSGDLTIVMQADRKLVSHPRSPLEQRALEGLQRLEFVAREHLRQEYTIRVTFLSDRHPTSEAFAHEVETEIDRPMYVSHFPLSVLPLHRESRMVSLDLHAPCAGKAEALRVLEERFGVPRERVVAVGDASNDVPMLTLAGLGVAMENSMPEVFDVVDRRIGHHDSDAIARLVEELFLT